MGQDAQVRRPLHIVVAAEDVGSAALATHVPERQLQDAVGPGVVVALGVLGAAHAPDDGARTVVGEGPRDAAELRARHARDALDLVRIPLGDLGPDPVHPPDALPDELLVLPAILEDVPEEAPDEPDIRSGPEADILVGMGRGPREARVANDQRRIVLLLRLQEMEERDRMRFRRVAPDQEDRPRIMDVVVGVGHCAIAPGVRDTCDRGRMANPGLVVHIVRAPIGCELAEQVGLLVGVLRRSQPVDGVGSGLCPQFEHLVPDLADRGLPGDSLPPAAHLLHGIFEAALAMGVLTH